MARQRTAPAQVAGGGSRRRVTDTFDMAECRAGCATVGGDSCRALTLWLATTSDRQPSHVGLTLFRRVHARGPRASHPQPSRRNHHGGAPDESVGRRAVPPQEGRRPRGVRRVHSRPDGGAERPLGALEGSPLEGRLQRVGRHMRALPVGTRPPCWPDPGLSRQVG